MKKRNRTKIMCMLMVLALLLSGGNTLPAAKAATTETEPVIGECENLVNYADFSFYSGHENWELSDLSDKVAGNTWYLSTTINFESISTWGGPELAFATGTVSGKEDAQMIRLGFRQANVNGQVVLECVEPGDMWHYVTTYGTIEELKSLNYPFVYGEDSKDYPVTIRVKDGDALSVWIDGEKVVDVSLSEKGITNLEPAIGARCYNSKGTLKDIKVWDDLVCPKIGKCENLVPDSLKNTISVDKADEKNQWNGWTVLEKVEGNTWYLSETVNFTSVTSGQWHDMAVALKSDKSTNIRVGINPGTGQCRMTYDTGTYMWSYSEKAIKSTFSTGISIATGCDYTLTVQVSNGDKLSFWINGKRVISEFSLAKAGYTDLIPAYGYRDYGMTGTVGNIQAWDGIVCPEVGKCENLVPDSLAGGKSFSPNSPICYTTELDRVSGNTWYISQTLKFTNAVSTQWHDTAVAVTGTINDDKTGKHIRVGVLPGTNQWRIAVSLEPIYQSDDYITVLTSGTSAVTIEQGKDHVLTVQVKGGKELSFWIDGKRVVCGYSLADYTDLRPAFGYRDYGSTGTVSNIQVWDGVTLKPDVQVESYADISDYREESGDTAPEEDGYVFAGWYTDEDCTIPVTTETKNVYAKFVNEDVLTVKAQLRAGTTADSESTDYRFVTTVDSLDYKEIGFIIKTNTKTTYTKGTSVYKKIVARNNEGKINYNDPTIFSTASEYFHTYSITNIPKESFGVEFTVSAYWVTQDGTTVTSPERTLSVNIGIAATTEG